MRRISGTKAVSDASPRPSLRATQRLHVVAYDFGIKRNILRLVADQGCRLTVVPATTSAQDVLALKPDGVLLSNGPGDPEPCDYAIRAIRELLDADVPIFGICLGHQLLGLASGAKTVKMKFGHHGANHPVQELATGRVIITSQNHGFAVDETTLPANVRAHAPLAVRRHAAGPGADRPGGVQFPGSPGGKSRAARSQCRCSRVSRRRWCAGCRPGCGSCVPRVRAPRRPPRASCQPCPSVPIFRAS